MSRTLQTFSAEGFGASMVEDDEGRCSIAAADADIDADGSPHAYHPHNSGTDDLANARDRDGRYVGILTNRDGEPLLQGADDPAPGFYISTTSYEFLDQPARTQRRYLDGENVPFIVLPPIACTAVKGMVLGCRARFTHLKTGRMATGIVGDIGPRTKVGELSPCAARLIGIGADPRNGGEDRPLIRYEWWPGEIWLKTFPLLAYRH